MDLSAYTALPASGGLSDCLDEKNRMRVGQARKRDANEKAIVAWLKMYGASVMHLNAAGAPDLLVLYRGQIYLLEVKQTNGKLTRAQRQRQAEGWPVYITRTVEEALTAIGVN